MKIGVVTDDGRIVSAHFGMAKHYLVFEIEGGIIKRYEMRPKASHQHAGTGHADRGEVHQSENEHSLHADMLSNVRDCQILVARGMGRPMYENIIQMGITPCITEHSSVEEAVRACIEGTLEKGHDPVDATSAGFRILEDDAN